VSDELDLILELVAEQAPALVAVDGVVYEGYIQSCLRGTVVAVARPVGARGPRAEYQWKLADVQIGRQVEAESVEEADELQLRARELAEQFGELSLAERVLSERARRYLGSTAERDPSVGWRSALGLCPGYRVGGRR
jgi:hypothetical protein